MALYCTCLSVYYSVLNVFSYLYIFSSLTISKLDYGICNVPDFNCSESSTDFLLSPEYLYHMYVSLTIFLYIIDSVQDRK